MMQNIVGFLYSIDFNIISVKFVFLKATYTQHFLRNNDNEVSVP